VGAGASKGAAGAHSLAFPDPVNEGEQGGERGAPRLDVGDGARTVGSGGLGRSGERTTYGSWAAAGMRQRTAVRRSGRD
jgi:hypothetical protein